MVEVFVCEGWVVDGWWEGVVGEFVVVWIDFSVVV